MNVVISNKLNFSEFPIYVVIGLFVGLLSCSIELTSLRICSFLVIVLLILCIVPTIVKKRTGDIDIFHTITLIPLIYFLYFGVGFYVFRLRGMFALSDESVSEETILTSLIVAIIGIIFFYVGYFSIYKIIKRKIFSKNIFSRWKQKKILVLIIYSSVFFVLVNLWLWLSIKGVPLFIPDYYREARTEIMAGKGYIYALCLAIVPFALLIANIYWQKEKKISPMLKIAFLSIILITIGILVLNVERGIIVSFLIFLFINYHYMKKRFSIKKIFVFFLIIVFLAGFGGYLRTRQWSEEERLFLQVLLLELLPEFDNYVKVIKNVPEHLELQWGRTIIPLFTNPIPRILLPNKDDFKPAGVVFKEFFEHYHIRIGERFTIVGELFMNFHIAGVIFGMFIFGSITAFVQKKLYPKDKNPFGVLLYCLILMALVNQIAGDIVSGALGSLQILLPVIAFYIILRIGKSIKGIAHWKEVGTMI